VSQHQASVSHIQTKGVDQKVSKAQETGKNQEQAPIRHEKEIETNTNNKPISNEIPATNPHFHAIKF
jgi:hypothetical protein